MKGIALAHKRKTVQKIFLIYGLVAKIIIKVVKIFEKQKCKYPLQYLKIIFLQTSLNKTFTASTVDFVKIVLFWLTAYI